MMCVNHTLQIFLTSFFQWLNVQFVDCNLIVMHLDIYIVLAVSECYSNIVYDVGR